MQPRNYDEHEHPSISAAMAHADQLAAKLGRNRSAHEIDGRFVRVTDEDGEKSAGAPLTNRSGVSRRAVSRTTTTAMPAATTRTPGSRSIRPARGWVDFDPASGAGDPALKETHAAPQWSAS
jgi:hypothetical protein